MGNREKRSANRTKRSANRDIRDNRGRWVKRVPGEYSDKVYTMRLTESEYQLVKHAKKSGIEPRSAMLETIRKRLEEHETA